MFQLSKARTPAEQALSGTEKNKLGKYVGLTILGAVGVVIRAYSIVESASFLASSVGIPLVVIGATVVAFGTIVPELSTSVDAVKKGHLELALGNIVGSCFMNITLILGVTLATSPLTINMSAFSNVSYFLVDNEPSLVVFPVKRKDRSARRNSFAFLVRVIPRHQPWLDTNRPDYLSSFLQ